MATSRQNNNIGNEKDYSCRVCDLVNPAYQAQVNPARRDLGLESMCKHAYQSQVNPARGDLGLECCPTYQAQVNPARGDTECLYIQNDSEPFGITIIPGSGQLTEFPETLDGEPYERNNIYKCFQLNDLCPKEFPPVNICIRDCTEFAAIAHINFINGDLVIGDPESRIESSDLLRVLPAPSNEILDIFPNLLGINGSLYIVGTHYKKITGFENLAYVTGSIIIANNPNLNVIPTFPKLLNIGGQVIKLPDCYDDNNGKTKDDDMSNPKCAKGVIIISNNKSLKTISGFEEIRQIKDGIFISDNRCLTHICGFIHLYRTDRIVINANPVLTKVIGFCYIDTINIGLYVLNNNINGKFDLVIGAFGKLETVGDLIIIGNSSFRSFKLESLRISGDFIVRCNNHLEEIVISVEFTTNIYIEKNKSLSAIHFPTLREINDSISICDNASLGILNSFDELKRIGGGIIISENQQLCKIKGFNKLKSIGSKCISCRSNIENDTDNDWDQRSQHNLPLCGQGCSWQSHCQHARRQGNDCRCVGDILYNWKSIKRLCDCTIVDDFCIDVFDASKFICEYNFDGELFKLLRNPHRSCGKKFKCETYPTLVSYSLIIFRNQRLIAIGGLNSLKHVNSNIYIIDNSTLHTIHSFVHLVFALDIWIRNNPGLKFIIGFSGLIAVRDFVIRESPCLINFSGTKKVAFEKLAFAQKIATETKSVKSIKYPSRAIPTVLGYTLYHTYDPISA